MSFDYPVVSTKSSPFSQDLISNIDLDVMDKISDQNLTVENWPDVALVFYQLSSVEIDKLMTLVSSDSHNCKTLSKEQLAELWIKQSLEDQQSITMRSLYVELNNAGISSQNERIAKRFPQNIGEKTNLVEAGLREGLITTDDKTDICKALMSVNTLLGIKGRVAAGYLGVPAERLAGASEIEAVADLIIEQSREKLSGIDWKDFAAALSKIGIATPEEYLFPAHGGEEFKVSKREIKAQLVDHASGLNGLLHKAIELKTLATERELARVSPYNQTVDLSEDSSFVGSSNDHPVREQVSHTEQSACSLSHQASVKTGNKVYKFSSCREGQIEDLLLKRKLSLPEAVDSHAKDKVIKKSLSMFSFLFFNNNKPQEQVKKVPEYTKTLGGVTEKIQSDELAVVEMLKQLSGENCIKLVLALSKNSEECQHGHFEMPNVVKSEVTDKNFAECKQNEESIRSLASKIICNQRNVCCWKDIHKVSGSTQLTEFSRAVGAQYSAS